jgi:hypothetical protein
VSTIGPGTDLSDQVGRRGDNARDLAARESERRAAPYTTAFLEVGKEPWVLSIPDMKGRYYLFPMLNGWTTVFQVPGKRPTGTGAQTYAITGPGWKGAFPAGVKEYKSSTNIVWLLGRIYCTGSPEDYKERSPAHSIQ